MAAIEQIINIATNTITADAASAAATAAGTAASNAQTSATNAQTAATNAQNTANAAIPHSAITVSAGSGITVAGTGNARTYTFGQPTTLNLSDVHTFGNANARNEENTVEWHVGDIAILTGSVTMPGMSVLADTGFNVSAFQGSSIRVNGGWDAAADAPVANLGFANGDTIQFRNLAGDIVGTTTPGDPNFVVSNLRQQGSTGGAVNNALFDITPGVGVFNPTFDGGSDILASTTGADVTVGSGTYVYTGTDQTAAGVTTNADWTRLEAPDSSIEESDLAVFRLDAGTTQGTPATLDSIVYDSTDNTLDVNGTSIQLSGTIGRNHYDYTGATALTINGLSSTGTGDQVFTVAIPNNWTHRFGPQATVPAAWPQSGTIYANGLRLVYGTDWTFNTARDTLTITITQADRRELGNGNTRVLNLVMETITS